jgi:spermidine/putrescine-binding protein
VTALRGSFPPQWLSLFRATQGRHTRLHVSLRAQLADIYGELRAGGGGGGAGKRPGANAAPDAVTLGDAWLAPAIVSGLIAPIPRAEASRWLARLPSGWSALLRRRAGDGAPAAGAPLWGVPYRWGCLLFALRTDVAATAGVADWGDLLRPALRRRVASVAAPRELLAAALRSLGASANTPCLASLPRGVTKEALAARIAALRAQMLLFSDSHHLKALAAGDAWVAVGYSQDVLPFAMRTPNVTVVAPASGTTLWADLWALPAARAGAAMAAHTREGCLSA